MTNLVAPQDDPVAVIESPIPGHTDEDLARDLRPEAPPSRVVSVLTKALLALALVSVGVVGGVLLDQHVGSPASGGTGNGTLQGGFGGGFGGGTGGPPAGFEPPAGFQPPAGAGG